jgi:hypothetical protein
VKEVPPTCEAKRLKAPLLIDGNVKKTTWEMIQPLPLVDNLQHEKRFETWVKVAWFDTHLYLAFWGEDTDIWCTLFQHDDALWRQEVFEFFFSPDGDLSKYYEIEWNANDAVFDAKISVEGGKRDTDLSWHAEGMKSITRVEKKADESVVAWSVEVAIPFSCIDRLEHPPYPGDSWRVNFFRIDMPLHQYPQDLYAWSPTGVADFHKTEFFGNLVFRGH